MTLRAALAVVVGAALALGICGCWLPALQLAPLAISAAQGVGSTLFGMAEGAVVMAHKGSGQNPDPQGQDPDHKGEDEMDREDRCEELQADVPGVVELRKSATGAPEYRELQLGGSLDQPRWTAVIGQDTNTGGWRPAANLLQMNFTPPLSNPIPGVGSSYLAYRSAQSESAMAEDLLVPLSLNFGTTAGTFGSGGREYYFALSHTLPCFPPPP